MNYPHTLDRAKTLLRQQHYAQAIQTAASALEHLLVELYQELVGQSSLDRQRELLEAQERAGGSTSLNNFTLGKIVGLHKASKTHRDLKHTLGLSFKYFNVFNLDPLVTVRNNVVHNDYQPDLAETTYIVTQIELILAEAGRLPPPPSPATTGDLRPWWHVAIPHQDIRQGRFDLGTFAIDLAQVVAGQGSADYYNAEAFFQRTYLTRGLRATLRSVLRRLAGADDGVAITQMATVFGGGKTHTLLALYHIVNEGANLGEVSAVQDLLHEAELEQIPTARVAAVDCAHLSTTELTQTPEGLTLHTLWGEIAYRLGGAALYELVRASDEARTAPGSEVLNRLFAQAGPSLILLDETLSYFTKASTLPVGRGYLSDQAQEFLLELTRSASTSDNVALVITMTSSEPEQIGEAAINAARAIDTATRILRRTRQVEVSAEREELYEILKRRLFDTDPTLMETQGRAVAHCPCGSQSTSSTEWPRSASP